MIRHLTALALLSLAISAEAGEPLSADYSAGIPVPASTLAATPVSQDFAARPAYSSAKPAVSVAMCGVEAYGANADLDAGLIDYNVPDPARAAGAAPDEQKDVGRNARDFHSSVVLGVTVGYHF